MCVYTHVGMYTYICVDSKMGRQIDTQTDQYMDICRAPEQVGNRKARNGLRKAHKGQVNK